MHVNDLLAIIESHLAAHHCLQLLLLLYICELIKDIYTKSSSFCHTLKCHDWLILHQFLRLLHKTGDVGGLSVSNVK